MTPDEKQTLITDAFIKFPNVTDEELERIGCMRVQYLQPSQDRKHIEIVEGFDAIPFELLEKKSRGKEK